MFLSDLSIKRPIFITMVLLTIVLFGLIAFRTIGIDLYPKVDFPVVTVISILPSADPETIESTVTDRIEEAVSSIDSIKSIRSISAETVSQVIIEFELEKDVDIAYQEVQAKIGTIQSSLPQDLRGPVIEKFNIDAAPILTVIASSSLPIAEFTRIVDKEIKQPLKKIPQVGEIKMVGGQNPKIWLWVDRDRLEAHQLTIHDIEQAIRYQHLDIPGGRITKDAYEMTLKTKGEFHTSEEFEELVIATQKGVAIRFKDIGTVEEGLEEERSAAHLNGKGAIAILVGCQSGANSVEVANRIKAEVDALQTKLAPVGIHLEIAQDNSLFIQHSVDEVRFHLYFGGGLAILIVLLFLRNLRSTFVCGLALPTAVIGTFGFMAYMGFTQNMMTLLALSIAIGLLIDDAIVVQENIIRHVEEGKNPAEASSFGCREIALAVLATTLSVVAVFVPVAFMKGIVGRFFYQFGLTVSFAVLISMFVSFTLNPLFSAKLLKAPKKGKIYLLLERLFNTLENAYGALLKFSIHHKSLIIGLALLSFVFSIFVAKFLRFEFVPLADQSEFAIAVKAPQGASLQFTNQLMQKIEERVKDHPWVVYLFSSVGADALRSVNAGSIYVKMTDKNKRSISQFDAMSLVRNDLSDISEGTIVIEPVERSGGGGKMTDIQFEIRGPSLDQLSTIAQTIVKKMKEAGGYVDISTSLEEGKPQVVVSIKRDVTADLGLNPYQIATAVRTAIGGNNVTTFKKEGDRYDVAIRLQEHFRDTIDKIGLITLRTSLGELVPLVQLVDLTEEKGPTQIDRYNRQRQITVYSNLDRSEKVLGEAIKEISLFFEQEGLPTGYTFDFAGDASSFKESFANLLFALMLAVVLVYMVLAAQFESFVHPFTIMLSLPLSIIGAIGSLVLFNMTMSIFTMIGIIMLMGLVTKNGILLIDFIQTLVKKQHMPKKEAIVLAGKHRLRPILMTTFAVVLGMLPIAIGTGSGSESRAPMAVAVIGGLLVSTLLTLVVIPVVYLLIEEVREKKLFSRKLLLKLFKPVLSGSANK